MRMSGDTAVDRECLRRRYRPVPVRLLFVGEAPPASGRFFYCANSGLYRTIRDTFVTAFPALGGRDFLASFRALGCYLVDLCATPVDRLTSELRAKTCANAEARLSSTLEDLARKSSLRSFAPSHLTSCVLNNKQIGEARITNFLIRDGGDITELPLKPHSFPFSSGN